MGHSSVPSLLTQQVFNVFDARIFQQLRPYVEDMRICVALVRRILGYNVVRNLQSVANREVQLVDNRNQKVEFAIRQIAQRD